MDSRAVLRAAGVTLALASRAYASGHGPVFGAATPTLGRDGWSLDQVWTIRTADDGDRQEMLRTMIAYGVTENLQISGSLPISLGTASLADSRMMSMMSGDRELEGLVAYRFHRQALGIGARRESTVYLGGAAPLDATRGGMTAGPSVEVGIATGYASRAHYLWVGGGVQHFTERNGQQLGQSRLVTFVYGYRPPALRTETGRPDLRFFVEMTGEDRGAGRTGNLQMGNGARTVFVGPTALMLHKAFGIEGGVLFPAYQRLDGPETRERVRVAVDVSYFFWLK